MPSDDAGNRDGDFEDVAHELGPETLETLGSVGCSIDDAGWWFDLSPDEMRARLEDPSLARAWERGKGRGRVRLRLRQFGVARTHPGTLIHICRHLLGQTDAQGGQHENVTLIVETGIPRDDPPPG